MEGKKKIMFLEYYEKFVLTQGMLIPKIVAS